MQGERITLKTRIKVGKKVLLSPSKLPVLRTWLSLSPNHPSAAAHAAIKVLFQLATSNITG